MYKFKQRRSCLTCFDTSLQNRLNVGEIFEEREIFCKFAFATKCDLYFYRFTLYFGKYNICK